MSERSIRHNSSITINAILGGMGLSIISATVLLLIYLQTEIWQMLPVSGASLAAFVCLLVARRLIHRNKSLAGEFWLSCAIIIPLVSTELLISGSTWIAAAAGLLILSVTVLAIRMHHPRLWIVGVALCTGIYVSINLFEPLPRYPADLSQPFAMYLIGLTVILVVAFLRQLYLGYRRISTIRSRMLVMSTLSSLLLATAITVTFALIGFSSGQQAARQQVDLAASLLTKDINAWVERLHDDLSDVFSEDLMVDKIKVLTIHRPEGNDFKSTYDQLLERLQVIGQQADLFEEIFVLDPQGYVIMSTDQGQVGDFQRHYTYFQEGSHGRYLQPPFHAHSLAEGDWSVVVSRPVTDVSGELLAVIAGRASLETLNAILEGQTQLSEGTDTYLISSAHVLLSGANSGVDERYHVYSAGADAAVDQHRNGTRAYDNHQDFAVLGAYRWLSNLQVALIVEQNQADAFQPTYAALILNLGVGAAGMLLVILATLAFTRSITAPLAELAETTEKVASGDLSIMAPAERQDETGILARSFNSMTLRLQDLVSDLESRVADRTRELEERSSQLEAATEVSHAVTSILDPDKLSRQVVDLIRDRFDLYYVGLFLVDPTGEWAELRAGTGDAGRTMLSRGHHLRVGSGMIGWSIAAGDARIAVEALDDTVRLSTAELPLTQSEAAIPLRSRGQVIGALSIQDSRVNAFDPASVAVFQTMADQIAVALDNARLFEAREKALQAERRAHGELSREAWNQLIREREGLGFRSDRRGLSPSSNLWRDEMGKAAERGETVLARRTGVGSDGADNRNTLTVPIKIRDKVVAVLDTHRPAEAGEWGQEEIGFLENIAEQMGVALENARLYENTQMRAERERLISDITAQVRAAGDVDGILRTAVHEIRRALGTSHGVIRLGTEVHLRPPESTDGNDSSNGDQNN
jgi:GAF domain-containing protein/HAMP domain-containing protein